jgi:thiamine pyrophosphate-dependent acetolactate synthase large subunit-like protein
MAQAEKKALDRRKAVTRLLADRGETLVVTGLGGPTWDVAAAGDSPNNFYLWGGMGGAVLVGLGLALAQPTRRVLVITGDGEMLMGLGGLATIGAQKPGNLAVCVIDNERYGETGMQETHIAHGIDLVAIALGAGFHEATTVRSEKDLDAAVPLLLRATGPVLVDLKVSTDPVPMILPTRDGPAVKHRFKASVLG